MSLFWEKIVAVDIRVCEAGWGSPDMVELHPHSGWIEQIMEESKTMPPDGDDWGWTSSDQTIYDLLTSGI